ncbi:MAG: hypothetical protein KDA80_24820 [Planctomycetaceae bacterium]|nr:hypothetical protein [Planctomycetaceae bacterium]
MSLTDEISEIRDRSLAALDASHDYFTNSKTAWRIVQQVVRGGNTFEIRNQTTGSQTDGTEIAHLAQQYVTGYLASATFQDFVAIFERFVFEFLTAWLTEYPRSLAGQQLKFQTVLDAADKSEVMAFVVEREVTGLAYKKVSDWFQYLEKLVNLGCPSEELIRQIVEIKASRDVLVHNSGIVNAIYVSKSGELARFVAGDKLELPESYHRQSWELIKQLVTEVANSAIEKLNSGRSSR